MNMLPNDHHPGPRCSCAECLRRYPELSEDAPTPATSKELISLRDACKHRGKSENCLLCKSADEIERLQQQVSSLRSALNMAGDLLTNQRRPTLAQEAQIIAALSGDSGPVAAHEPLSALAEMEKRKDAIRSVIDEMIHVAADGDRDEADWTADNCAQIDAWQVRLADAIATQPPTKSV